VESKRPSVSAGFGVDGFDHVVIGYVCETVAAEYRMITRAGAPPPVAVRNPKGAYVPAGAKDNLIDSNREGRLREVRLLKR
jgi:hypothetical protein